MNEESDDARLVKYVLFTYMAGPAGYAVSTILAFMICLPFGLLLGRNAVYWTERAGLVGAGIAVMSSIVYFWLDARSHRSKKIAKVSRRMADQLIKVHQLKP